MYDAECKNKEVLTVIIQLVATHSYDQDQDLCLMSLKLEVNPIQYKWKTEYYSLTVNIALLKKILPGARLNPEIQKKHYSIKSQTLWFMQKKHVLDLRTTLMLHYKVEQNGFFEVWKHLCF